MFHLVAPASSGALRPCSPRGLRHRRHSDRIGHRGGGERTASTCNGGGRVCVRERHASTCRDGSRGRADRDEYRGGVPSFGDGCGGVRRGRLRVGARGVSACRVGARRRVGGRGVRNGCVRVLTLGHGDDRRGRRENCGGRAGRCDRRIVESQRRDADCVAIEIFVELRQTWAPRVNACRQWDSAMGTHHQRPKPRGQGPRARKLWTQTCWEMTSALSGTNCDAPLLRSARTGSVRLARKFSSAVKMV
ncbi:hypothetical protein C8Q76DRAFT_414109 [Earliella scabrosa]|nr:hypothetical protein C8Q76DRAFT_414109 [Earliella scabrosa]